MKKPQMVAVVIILAAGANNAHASRAGSYALWCGAKAGDLLSTEAALAHGARELNPLMQHQGIRISASVASCLAIGEGDHRLRHHTKLRWVVRALGVGAFGYATVRNVRNAR